MRTTERVQVSVAPVEIKVTGELLTLRAEIEISLPAPRQDEHLPDTVERTVEQAGQEVKRSVFRQLMEKLDAELILTQRSGYGGQGMVLRGKRSMTFKTIFGRVKVNRHRVQHKANGLVEVPAARVWGTPQQVTLTTGLQAAVCDAMLREPSRKSLREITTRADDPSLLGRVTILDVVHREGQGLRDAAEARAQRIFQELPQACNALSPAVDDSVHELPAEEPSRNEDSPLLGFPGASSAEAVAENQPRQVDPRTIMVQADEVVVHAQPSTGMKQIKVYTAVVRSQTQTWYFTAAAAQPLIRQVGALLAACGILHDGHRLLFLNDGARWIRDWFDRLKVPSKTMILCWYHLAHRVRGDLGMACRGRKHREEVAQEVLGHLWEGRVEEALSVLDRRRSEMRCVVALRQLKEYLEKRRPMLPDYAARRNAGLWIASTRVEKFNDWSVTQRCKHRGMDWTRDGVVALSALEAARRNQELTYWQRHRSLPEWVVATPPSTST